MVDTGEFGIDIGGGDDIAIGEMAKVQLDSRLKAPFERNFVDRDRAVSPVHRRSIVVGRIKVSAMMGRKPNSFVCPSFTIRKMTPS